MLDEYELVLLACSIEKTEEQKKYEQKLYHNTEVLLRKYRDVVWSLEISAK